MSRFLAWGWGDGAIECFSLIFYFSFVLYEREPWVSLQLLFLDLKISIFMILISNLALNCPLQNFLSISFSSSFNQLCTSCLKEKTQTKPDINCLFRLFMVINQQFKHLLSWAGSSLTVVVFWCDSTKSSISLEFLVILDTTFDHVFPRTLSNIFCHCLSFKVVFSCLTVDHLNQG